jgi:hypothetical protein
MFDKLTDFNIENVFVLDTSLYLWEIIFLNETEDKSTNKLLSVSFFSQKFTMRVENYRS